MKGLVKKFVNLIIIVVLLQASGFSALAANRQPGRPTPQTPQTVETEGPARLTPSGRQPVTAKVSADLLATTDTTQINVSVRGSMPSLAQVARTLSAEERAAYVAKVSAFQDTLEKGIVANGGQVIYRYRTLGSGVIASMPAKVARTIAGVPGVANVSRINDFELDLSETVGFIGGDTLKSFGIKGAGVKVAILDSGIDFTHLAFGGSANPALWEAAYYGTDPACTTGREAVCANRQAVAPAFAGLFGPSGLRVKGGFDWVGPAWPSGALMPDPNPIALASTGTHGTHVADIIGGLGYAAGSYGTAPNTVNYAAKGEGMAPEADLYAFTVCSAVATSCSGVAMLEGMDDAADLDNNPVTIDPADVINMSLGSDYGQPEDDATWLSNELTKYGSIVVLSAGNGGNVPYKVGSPSISSGAISVAQTAVPSAKQFRVIINTPLPAYDLNNPLLISFTSSYFTATISGDVVFDNTDADTRRGCQADGTTPPAAWTAGRFTDKIVLINRGTCAASYKVANAQAAGAKMVLIAMVTAADPVDFSYGGGVLSIPAFTITQADGNTLKGFYATQPLPAQVVTLATATANPAVYISLANTIATTSSRGPRNHDNKIKPDVGAPGASVSAIAGTGSESAAFGGTSGAAPMVTGSMALLKALFHDQQNFVDPQLTVAQYKALLMNSANNQIFEGRSPTNPTGTLLPVARIGAGQVDLTKALKTKVLAYDVTDANPVEWAGSLSYQYLTTTAKTTLTRKLRLVNLNPFERTVMIGWDYRYATEDNGAVTLAPSKNSVTLAPGAHEDIDVVMTIDPSKLAPWFDWNNWFLVDRGGLGGDGANFKQVEYSGYLSVYEVVGTSVLNTVTVPWLVIPKPAADVDASATKLSNTAGTINLAHVSGVTSNADLFNLVDINPNDYNYQVGNCASVGLNSGCNESPIDIKEVGYRMWQSSSSYVDFAITVWDYPYRAGIWPAEFDILVDTVHPVLVTDAGANAATAIPYAVGPDGIPDYLIYNYELGGFGASGIEAVYVKNLHSAAAASAVFYLDSTFDSNNYILTVPASVIGLTIPVAADADPAVTQVTTAKMNFQVLAYEAYMSGYLYDTSPKVALDDTFTEFSVYHSVDLLADRWKIASADQMQTIHPGITVNVAYTLNTPPAWIASGSQIGFLALYREGPIQKESDAVQLGPVIKYQAYFPLQRYMGALP